MNHVAKKEQGFTLIELLLAMTFVSILLLIIAMTVIQLSSIYNKGLTMKSVDQAGRAIATDIRQTLSGSSPFSLNGMFWNQRNAGVSEDAPDGGRFCTGAYSYIWNYGRSIDSPINVYDTSTDTIRFVKVRDNGAQYCADQKKKIIKENASELLAGGDTDLAIQSFQVKELASDPTTGQALYRIIMEIGTNNQDALDHNRDKTLDTMDVTCKPPSDDSSVQNFCAVNVFDFTAQAGNRGAD
ncbi:type II secretion system protein [Candidatus Saccharibacteria bacterium]|jgi:prepilin-type N-terminal cleavage/methylation domain-containing protein|nr:type II secretion system protein [Candidatus Saccharibacteria bacterium]